MERDWFVFMLAKKKVLIILNMCDISRDYSMIR